MKRVALLLVSCIILLSILSACDVITALEITPAPSPILSLTPERTPEPTPMLTPEPTPEPTPMPTPEPTPTLLPTPKPDVHTLPGDTVITFQDPGVEKLIRTLLVLPERDITVAEMRKITSFDYNPDIYSFANSKIYSVEDLRYCENLEYLYITGNRVSDLSPLAELKSLQSIWIGGNPVTDASAVLALPSLLDFNALNTGITDISALSTTQNLRTFYCDSEFKDITPLFAHKNLWQILLTGINDDSFQALLRNCKGLSSIRIQNSKIKDSTLSLFKGRSLFMLHLENCGIKDISSLAELENVEYLRLPNNNIKDISPLKGIRITSSLDLSKNAIEDWSPLKGMTGLAKLLISGNPVTQSKVLDGLEKGGCKITR